MHWIRRFQMSTCSPIVHSLKSINLNWRNDLFSSSEIYPISFILTSDLEWPWKFEDSFPHARDAIASKKTNWSLIRFSPSQDSVTKYWSHWNTRYFTVQSTSTCTFILCFMLTNYLMLSNSVNNLLKV